MTMDFATLKQDFKALMEYNMRSHDDMRPERLSSVLYISESEVQDMLAGMSTNGSNYMRCLNYLVQLVADSKQRDDNNGVLT